MRGPTKQQETNRSRFVAIVNPASGRRDMVPVVERVGRRLFECGARLEILLTACAGDATRIAEQASQSADAVLVVGGDGTVCEVVNGLIDTSIPIVVLRTGTENLIARELDMPRSPQTVADTLLKGRSVPCDVCEANGRRFLAVVGVGFDAECVQRMVQVRRGHITRMDYFWPIWRTFWGHRFPALQVYAGDELVFDGRGFALCGGFPRYSVGLRPLARAKYDDGLLDVCVFPCSSKLELVGHAAGLFCGTHLDRGGTIYRQATRIRIESPERVATEVDGEVGDVLPLDCRILKNAAAFLLP
jgi:YegS/Rv2252/BmrU family lipid kinase